MTPPGPVTPAGACVTTQLSVSHTGLPGSLQAPRVPQHIPPWSFITSSEEQKELTEQKAKACQVTRFLRLYLFTVTTAGPNDEGSCKKVLTDFFRIVEGRLDGEWERATTYLFLPFLLFPGFDPTHPRTLCWHLCHPIRQHSSPGAQLRLQEFVSNSVQEH